MEAQYNKRKSQAIDKFDDVIFAGRKKIKVDQLMADMSLFGDGVEDDDEESEVSSEFAEEDKADEIFDKLDK